MSPLPPVEAFAAAKAAGYDVEPVEPACALPGTIVPKREAKVAFGKAAPYPPDGWGDSPWDVWLARG